jgi:hypothetical protein
MAGLFQVCDLYVRIVLIHAFQNIWRGPDLNEKKEIKTYV